MKIITTAAAVNENKVEKIIVPTNDNKKKKDLIDLNNLSLEELEG